ncbi:unnamed protein product [Penicillium roqueforti FM164]|uniref:Uncharacterized protein n=1 Tax=Penicillium roqueforti (strain FM164) TaxID=1365484 RepID=W6QM14_PENRF|nr:unnamed protein product [Penicillium roqueforti FM164]
MYLSAPVVHSRVFTRAFILTVPVSRSFIAPTHLPSTWKTNIKKKLGLVLRPIPSGPPPVQTACLYSIRIFAIDWLG